MAFLRFSRDRRGYEHFYLIQPTTSSRGKSRGRLVYFFRSPPNVKIGREPFDDEARRAIEGQYPNVQFDEMTEFIKRHDVKLDSIVSHQFPLEDGPEAYRISADANSGKVVFSFN